jgi:integrase
MEREAVRPQDSNADSNPRRTSGDAGSRQRTKRGNYEGSVYRRSDGRWVAAVSLGDGKRVHRYAKTRADAAAKLAAVLKTAQDQLPIPPERGTVGQFLEDWLANTAKRSVRPSTFVSYEGLVRVHLVPELGKVSLIKLSPQHVERMINRKLTAGLSPRRVEYMRAVLRRALNDALRWGLVARNVATLVTPPRAQRYEIRPLDPDQARAFLEAIQGDRLQALYSVALAVGLRQGEALGLRWEDVDLEQGTIHVRRALQRVDGTLQLVEPKTARSRRVVVLPGTVAAGLQQHRARQVAERLAAGSEWVDAGLVFCSPTGRPLDASNVTHAFQRHLARAGLPRQRFHDLRHACASLLLAQGVNPRVVMEVLGHSQITLTLNTYSHVLPSLTADAASRMDALLAVPMKRDHTGEE